LGAEPNLLLLLQYHLGGAPACTIEVENKKNSLEEKNRKERAFRPWKGTSLAPICEVGII
jgi:hypothetical protein